ncbi:hypothetical protein RJT34_31173 [Clitoria ternatea]|uniref:Uncharacterized protein n=1 Tax=Clitoria ternatea TaxID=43366 RepID=A0AAN9EVZ5_CLITE
MEDVILVPWWRSLAGQGNGERRSHFSIQQCLFFHYYSKHKRTAYLMHICSGFCWLEKYFFHSGSYNKVELFSHL